MPATTTTRERSIQGVPFLVRETYTKVPSTSPLARLGLGRMVETVEYCVALDGFHTEPGARWWHPTARDAAEAALWALAEEGYMTPTFTAWLYPEEVPAR
jgi:hypothetical protein